MRVVYFGTGGRFSALPLQCLLDSGVHVVAVVTPGRSRPISPEWQIPVFAGGEPPLEALVREREIRHIPYSEWITRVRLELEQQKPELMLVACFPWRIPTSLYSAFPKGAFNLHPSLLPAYRGPDPLFWQFRAGERVGGVTWHVLTDRLDAGPIAAQAPWTFPDGVREASALEQLGKLGGELAAELVARVGSASPTPRAQDERQASYFSWPRETDYALSSSWSAPRAYNFVRAIAARGRRLIVETQGTSVSVRDAVDFSTDRIYARGATLADPSLVEVGFSDGVVVFRR